MSAALPNRIPNDSARYPGSSHAHGDPRQRLIVALDVSTAAAAQKIVAAVGDVVCFGVSVMTVLRA